MLRIAVVLSVLLSGGGLLLAQADAAKDKPDKPPHRKGTVVGVVTAKGDNWIEVRADGEEKARRYVPHWRGGTPAQGDGFDKEMLAHIRATPVGSRVRLEWEFEERPRVVKLEILKKADSPHHSQGKPEATGVSPSGQRSGKVTGTICSKKEQGKNVVIEVLAPGEEKPRAYFVQFDPKLQAPIPEMLAAVRAAPVGAKVHLEWVATGHGPAIVRLEVLDSGQKKDKP